MPEEGPVAGDSEHGNGKCLPLGRDAAMSLVRTDVPEERIASLIRSKKSATGTC
jgi:hypothetical protein